MRTAVALWRTVRSLSFSVTVLSVRLSLSLSVCVRRSDQWLLLFRVSHDTLGHRDAASVVRRVSEAKTDWRDPRQPRPSSRLSSWFPALLGGRRVCSTVGEKREREDVATSLAMRRGPTAPTRNRHRCRLRQLMPLSLRFALLCLACSLA